MLTYCDPHISRPLDFEGAKLSQIFRLVCEYIRYYTYYTGIVKTPPELLGSIDVSLGFC